MTLVELIIGMTLASVLMTAVLSSFLFLGRSGFALSHYNEMELQARLGLERFAEDVRQASDPGRLAAGRSDETCHDSGLRVMNAVRARPEAAAVQHLRDGGEEREVCMRQE